ncbi:MAG: universal stress protein UspA [Micrococcales bacterium]|nr:universal stress protein UspA [Micrococcales bacterium]
MSDTIVVGFDGSPEAHGALRWAIWHAVKTNGRLSIVVSWTLPALELTGIDQPVGDSQLVATERDMGEDILQEALGIAVEGGVPATGAVMADSPARALIDASKAASLLVVGSRGQGTFASLLLGSVSRQVATHARCTTVIVRDAADPESLEVVVGVDGSQESRASIEFAFAETDLIDGSLRVLHGWEIPPIGVITGVPRLSTPELVTQLRDDAARAVTELLSGVRNRYPDIEVVEDEQQGNPVELLTEASESAAMVVVGSRGRGGFLGLLLGSVSHGVAHHAKCSVAIVR